MNLNSIYPRLWMSALNVNIQKPQEGRPLICLFVKHICKSFMLHKYNSVVMSLHLLSA